MTWNCCDSKMLWLHFVYLPVYLFLKLFNIYEHVTVGVVLSEHSEKCNIAIFCQCHTQSVISVNETVETESCIIVRYIELHFSLYWAVPQSYQFLWPWPLRVRFLFDQVMTFSSWDNLPLPPLPQPSSHFAFCGIAFYFRIEIEMSMCNISVWMAIRQKPRENYYISYK